jgi:predicted nucleic acid-binding Zn ribbon protein
MNRKRTGFLFLAIGLIMIIGAMIYAIPVKEIPGIDITELVRKIMLDEVRRDRAIEISFFGLGIAMVGALLAFSEKEE